MHLSALRALPVGAPLLAGPDSEPVLLAGIAPPGPGRRASTVRVLTVLGDEREVQTRQLAAAPATTYPDAVVLRPDLTGHTVTVERITARIWPRLGPQRGVVGDLAAIERTDGRLGKVCCIAADLWGGGDIQTAARSYADGYGARYVPAEPAPSYPEPGSEIPGQPGFVVADCHHRVAASEWRAGFRTCERCPSESAGGAR